MDLELSDDQLALRSSIHTVLTRESPLSVARAAAERGERPDAVWSTFTELGWPGLTVSEDHGGVGLGAVEAAVLCEELGRVLAGTPLLSTVTQFVPLVQAVATAAQQQRWLGAVAQGTCRATIAVAERDGSFALQRTAATASRAGNDYVLSGTKRFVFEADRCDVIACTVLVDGALSVAFVPAAAATIVAMRSIDATRSYCDVILDGVTVSGDDIAIAVHTQSLQDAMEHATLGLALETVGVASAIFDVTLEYAKQREQFGVPIGSFQAIKHKFADLAISVERARSLGYYAALCVAEADDRRHLAVAAAKAAAGDAQRTLSTQGIQIHGGIGYTWEHDMHLYVRRAKSNEQLFGTARMHRESIASLLGV